MITLVRVTQTSMACPSQWDAWDAEGNYYYLRFRHGCGSVTQYEDEGWKDAGLPDSLQPAQEPRYIADFEYGDEFDGVITLEEFAQRAHLALSPALVTTGFGDFVRDQLILDGMPLHIADMATRPWRDLDE